MAILLVAECRTSTATDDGAVRINDQLMTLITSPLAAKNLLPCAGSAMRIVIANNYLDFLLSHLSHSPILKGQETIFDISEKAVRKVWKKFWKNF